MAARPTRKLTIALLAQVVFCLAVAPVVLAREAAKQDPGAAGRAPKGEEKGTSVQAAFEASNVRPEEDSNSEQKKGRPRSDAGSRNASARRLRDAMGDQAGREPAGTGVSARGAAASDNSASSDGQTYPSIPAALANDTGRAVALIVNGPDALAADEIRFVVSRLNAGNPAAQPIGPPLS